MSNIKIIISGLLILLILVMVYLVFSRKPNQTSNSILPVIQISPVPSSGNPPTSQQKSFKIIDSDPKNQQTEVYSGEIEISFTTDNDILSDKDFSLDITPKLPFYFKFTNSYPTKKIVAKVYGGLQTNTIYQLNVKDKVGRSIYAWSFTTSSKSSESSSALMEEQEKELIKKYYPLFDYIPFSSADFDLDYTGHLILEVKVKNSDVNKVKLEAEEWIRSKGVDPKTHTINYINSF